MSNLYRKLESDQCRHVLPIVGSWHVNLVLFCFDGGQVPQRCLVSKFVSSIKCFGLLPQVHAQQATSLFWWLSQEFYTLQLGKEKHKVHHVLNKMLWPFTTRGHGAGPFWLQFLSSDGEVVIHSPACFSMKTTSWAGAIRAKLMCVVRACTRVIYSRAGFGERLLAWLTSEPTCTNSFCPNWSRLPQEGSLWRNLLHLR